MFARLFCRRNRSAVRAEVVTPLLTADHSPVQSQLLEITEQKEDKNPAVQMLNRIDFLEAKRLEKKKNRATLIAATAFSISTLGMLTVSAIVMTDSEPPADASLRFWIMSAVLFVLSAAAAEIGYVIEPNFEDILCFKGFSAEEIEYLNKFFQKLQIDPIDKYSLCYEKNPRINEVITKFYSINPQLKFFKAIKDSLPQLPTPIKGIIWEYQKPPEVVEVALSIKR